MLEKSHHGSFESCDGTLFFVIHSPEVATHVHIYCLSIVYLFVYLFVYPWVYGRVSPLQGLTMLGHLYPTLPLSHSVPSFSGGVSNGRASSRLWTISSSCYILGVTWLRLPPSRLLTLFSSSFQGIAQASLVPVLASFASCSLLQTTISMSLIMYTGQLWFR